jgi:predicted nucleic acid-binding protein
MSREETRESLRSASAPVLVVDASVAVKWYLPEIHEAEAKRVLDPRYALHVPDLFFSEFGNIVWKKALLKRELAVDEATEIVARVLTVPMRAHSSATVLASALGIALATRRTVYDCTYLALAIAVDGWLITADEAFVNAMEDGPFDDKIIRVADMP